MCSQYIGGLIDRLFHAAIGGLSTFFIHVEVFRGFENTFIFDTFTPQIG